MATRRREIPDIDFHGIRPHGTPPSRSGGFEELSSILIEQGVADWPSNVRFERFGTPDAGREGRGVLPNGDVWAWQSKYLFRFDASAAAQVTASIRRALLHERSLTRYFVAMPLDLPSGDTNDRGSAHTRWTKKVGEWEALAREQGREVEFVFVGAHPLVTALTEARHAGRASYWFGADVMTADWQGRRLEDAIAKAGRRYSPRLHVEVDPVQAIHAVGRADAYLRRWQDTLAALRKAREWPWRAPFDALAEVLTRTDAAVDEADAALEFLIACTRSAEQLPSIDGVLDAASELVSQVDRLLHQHALTKDGYFIGDAAYLYSKIRAAGDALGRAQQLARGPSAQAAREKALLVVGRAGVGKTHLFCDVAARRIGEGRPTVLLMGQDFDGRALLGQVGELTQFDGSLDQLLSVLDAAAEAAGCMGLLMLDALNESEKSERWNQELRALLVAAARCSHVAVVVSCRVEFSESVVGDTQVATVEHFGFAEGTDLAVRRFTQEYGLEPPTFPVLNPEFDNPLYLKLTCEALATLGATRFPLGTAGLATVCEAFLEAVNKRLSEAARCDYDERRTLVQRAVQEIALLGRGAIGRERVQRVTEQALPNRPWSRSLMQGMLHEGVLSELSDGRITFGYQRLGDVAHAMTIAETSADDVRAWVGELGDASWRERGVLGALAVIVPERHGIEVIDLSVDGDGQVPYEMVDAFLESLILRSSESVSARTVAIVSRLLDGNHRVDQVWDRLIRIACVPDHLLNARWLHARLGVATLAARDASWSSWLVGGVEADEDSAVRRMLDWAWPADLGDLTVVPEAVAELATLMLGWLLTTSDRRVRDRATKALVNLAGVAPAPFARAIGWFRGVNDPYVVERLAAAACGAVLRTNDAGATNQIADGAIELVADGWPDHLMTRDYLRRVFSAARSAGWAGERTDPPYGAPWPVTTRGRAEIESLAGPPDYSHSSIWHSIAGGDFGRYLLEPALRHLACENAKDLQGLAARAVFDRVLDLGWTPDLFKEADRRRSSGRDGPVERVGKKYQWIGFYEVLGRIADHCPVKTSWGDGPAMPYAHPEQLIWRDIDPTVLVRKPRTPGEPKPLWFSPAEAQFPPGLVTQYPDDMSGVPDPLDLISLSDSIGSKWLVLGTSPDWEQPLSPEVEALRVPRPGVWMKVHAYLIPVTKVATVSKWAQRRDWSEQRLPDLPDAHNVLLGAYPDDPAWPVADYESDDWVDRRGRPPADPVACTTWYGGTGTSRDSSSEEETRGYLPSRQVLDSLGLRRGVDFSWSDRNGIAICDPSVVSGGPPTLVMRRDLLSKLKDSGFTVLWTVLVGNELHRNDFSIPGDEYRWISASATYVLEQGRVELVGARAARLRPGPREEHGIAWAPRAVDDQAAPR